MFCHVLLVVVRNCEGEKFLSILCKSGDRLRPTFLPRVDVCGRLSHVTSVMVFVIVVRLCECEIY